MAATEPVERQVIEALAATGGIVVGFSGGVDSGVLSDLATEALGSSAIIATAVSPSLPTVDREDAARVAAERGWRHREIATDELTDEAYVANGPDRCFHCRTAFFAALEPLKAELGIDHVALATVTDDLGDHRPGQVAARRAGVLTPLADAGIAKSTVRDIARRRSLPLAEKPANACLSSRIPYGTPVTTEALSRVERGEHALRTLGFSVCRVRDHGDCALVEVPAEELEDALARRHHITRALQQAGYVWVGLDLEGFRSGSMNAALPLAQGNSAP